MSFRWNKRVAASAALVIAAAAAIVYYSLYSRGAEERGFVSAVGTVEAREVQLSSKVTGRIEWLCCKEGDRAAAGQEALVLETRAEKARRDEAAAAASAAAEAVKEAVSGVANAEALLDAAGYESKAASFEADRTGAIAADAAENAARAAGLFNSGYMSKKEHDAARTASDAASAAASAAAARRSASDAAMKTARAGVGSARARRLAAEARRAQAEASVAALDAALSDARVASPINGVVAYRAFEPGEVVKAGDAVYTLYDLDELWARVDVEETDVAAVALGARAELTAPGLPGRVFKGKVIEVGQTGSFATQHDTMRGRPDIKTFRVKAAIEAGGGALKPGMTVEVRVFPQAKAAAPAPNANEPSRGGAAGNAAAQGK